VLYYRDFTHRMHVLCKQSSKQVGESMCNVYSNRQHQKSTRCSNNIIPRGVPTYTEMTRARNLTRTQFNPTIIKLRLYRHLLYYIVILDACFRVHVRKNFRKQNLNRDFHRSFSKMFELNITDSFIKGLLMVTRIGP